MHANITCAICGAKFNSLRNNAKYCSPNCKVEGQKKARKNWESNNPEYDKNRMKKYRESQKRPPKFWKT